MSENPFPIGHRGSFAVPEKMTGTPVAQEERRDELPQGETEGSNPERYEP